VLVVRIDTGQLRDVRMFERVIPGNFFVGMIDFIAIAADACDLKVDELPDIEDQSSGKMTCPSSLASVAPMVARTVDATR
jgi:hypothetical protein